MAIGVPAGLASLVGLDSSSSWQDRLKEAAYKSPTGTRIKLKYTFLERSVDARGTEWEFAGVDGAYIQRGGFGARKYPLRVLFSGADHDRIANAFFAALLEPGIGTFEHPFLGPIKVTPFGTITERQDLVTEANQTVIDVPFFTTFETVYPSSKADAQNEILAALGDFDVEAAQAFEADTDLLSAASKANLKATIRAFLRDVSGAMSDVSGQVASVRREFADTMSLINNGMDVFIGQPLLLAQQISNLIQAPGRALTGLQSRLAGYEDLAGRIFGSKAGSPGSNGVVIAGVSSTLTRASNDFHAASLFGMNAVAGTVTSSLNNTFGTRPETLDAVQRVLDLFDEMVAWRDTGFDGLSEIDTGGAYQALHTAVSLTAGRLIEASFTLVPERIIVLDRPRTIIDLAAEIYGSVDDRLDFLIASNDLTGAEILELPRGASIKYYPTPS
jgi:hypothetical protein